MGVWALPSLASFRVGWPRGMWCSWWWLLLLLLLVLERASFCRTNETLEYVEEPEYARRPATSLVVLKGSASVERSVIVRRVLLVLTLDGTIYAFDKYTGAFYWENQELGGQTIRVEHSAEASAFYLVEPLDAGSMYVHYPGSDIKVSRSICGLNFRNCRLPCEISSPSRPSSGPMAPCSWDRRGRHFLHLIWARAG